MRDFYSYKSSTLVPPMTLHRGLEQLIDLVYTNLTLDAANVWLVEFVASASALKLTEVQLFYKSVNFWCLHEVRCATDSIRDIEAKVTAGFYQKVDSTRLRAKRVKRVHVLKVKGQAAKGTSQRLALQTMSRAVKKSGRTTAQTVESCARTIIAARSQSKSKHQLRLWLAPLHSDPFGYYSRVAAMLLALARKIIADRTLVSCDGKTVNSGVV